MTDSYAHICRDDHIQIGHNDSSDEMCPLCRALNLLRRVEDEWSDGQYITRATLASIQDEMAFHAGQKGE